MSAPIIIHDLSIPELDIYTNLNENQLRRFFEPEPGIFIAESPNVIARAIAGGYEPISMLLDKKMLSGQMASIINQCSQISVYTAESDVLSKLTGFSMTRGALCAMRRKDLPSVESVCKNARRIAVLENVMNPTNVGAIFRSAAALGMDGVLLTAGCSDPLYRRSVRVSMGTVFQIPWTFLPPVAIPSTNFASSASSHSAPSTQRHLTDIHLLHTLGFKTAAMALSLDSVNVDDANLMKEDKLALILGTESEGLYPQTIADSDYTVCIPMAHGVDSLNVAAASAVAFWQLGRKQ